MLPGGWWLWLILPYPRNRWPRLPYLLLHINKQLCHVAGMVVRVFFLVFRVRDSPFLVMVGRVDKTRERHPWRLWTTLFTEISFLHEFNSCSRPRYSGRFHLPWPRKAPFLASWWRWELFVCRFPDGQYRLRPTLGRKGLVRIVVSSRSTVCLPFVQTVHGAFPALFGAGNLMFWALTALPNTVSTSIVIIVFH